MAAMRRPILTLLLLATVTFFLGLGRQAMSDGDESYYAEAAREMVEGGDWLTPHFNYQDRWEKPVLYYWMTAATYELTGPTEAAARFWSALAGVGLVLLTFAIAEHFGAPPDTAWLAGAITATCFGYFAEARLALPDLPLTFFITLTIWLALRQRWSAAGVATGLGFLAKGPVALVLPAIVVLPIWAVAFAQSRSGHAAWIDRINWRGVLVGAAIFSIVGLPWYAAMTLTHGRAYLESFFVGDNFERFATHRFGGETRPWWFYGPILAGGLMPWTFYGGALLVGRLFRTGQSRWHLSREQWQLLLWSVMPLLFYTISLGKQPRYILPVLPPIAILTAFAMARRTASSGTSQPAIAIATWLTAGLLAAMAMLFMRARALFITAYAPMTSLGIALLLACAVVLVALAITRAWARLPVTMGLAASVSLLTLQFGALAGVRPEPVERMAQLVRAYRVDAEPVGECDVFVRNLVFYARYRQEKDLCTVDTSQAATFLASPTRVFLVVQESDAAALRAKGLTARELGRVEYIDPANIKLRTLLWPNPERDLETIVLVTNR